MSQMRRCEIWKAVDQKWYLRLGNFEYAELDEDCTVYGPFVNQQGAMNELDQHANPGGYWIDDSGTDPVPPNAKGSRRF